MFVHDEIKHPIKFIKHPPTNYNFDKSLILEMLRQKRKKIRISSKEKKKLMDGILHDIEQEQLNNVKIQPKKVSWKEVKNKYINLPKLQITTSSMTS